MKILSHIRKSAPFGLRSWGILLVLALCSFVCARAQVIIGGNVYGGGDMGDVNGSTTVHVLSGDMEGSVFGGARMANVGGSAFVNIDGAMTDNENKEIAQTDYIVINRVYGGNDISGTIGDINTPTTPPTELTNKPEEVDNSFKTFVHISNQKDKEGDTKQIYIGQLFGGGNGDYGSGYDTYTDGIYQGKNKPVLTNTYVDIQGGSIVYAYGGGNNATVTGKAVIHVDNPSEVVNHILSDKTDPTSDLLTSDRFKRMGINTGYSHPSSDEFQIGRLFGGNNQAEMAIRPTWYLKSGKIRNLYSGGNKGPMTNMQGLLLDIDPRTADGENPLVIDNVYGGSRMADVRPLRSGRIDDNPVNAQEYEIQLGSDVKDKNGQSYAFPDGLAARVLVRGGKIRNVYGGNDVTGRVYGGNAVGIYTTIYGDVYGGGNGSYPYTDNPALENDDVYGDLYYGNFYGKPNSIQKLNDFRPDAEQISIRLKGNSSNEKTIIHGSVYLGGNSATIDSPTEDPLVQLRIGSHVIADKVFMGNNGENMVTINEQKVDDNEDVTQMEGILHAMAKPITIGNETSYFNSIDLKIEENFKAYMEGAAMSLNPNSKNRIVIDDDYEDYSTQIGSFYCGGNVGSMTYSGKQTMDFDEKIIIYDKLVGGCNNADVPKTAYNAAYEGGVMGSASEIQQNSTIDRLELNFNGVRVVPKRWNEGGDDLVFNTAIWGDIYTQVSTGTTLTNGGTYYTSATGDGKFTVNVDNRTVGENESIFEKSDEDFINTGTGSPDDTHDDQGRRLMGGNIYGGCYNSGHVNGNIVININDNIIDRYGPNGIFADAIPDPDDHDGLIINGDGERRSGVILDNQAVDVMAVAMTVFGAGKGKHTEVWGSTTVNLNKGYTLQIFGGGEEGVVGKGATNDTYDSEGYYVKTYTPYTDTQEDQAKAIAYSSTVNLDGESAVYNDTDNPADLAEAEYMYGGGNEGDVYGNSYVYLGNGRIYDAFGGASDAKIYGHTEVYIGHNSSHEDKFPYIRDIVYGGNDFGGSILGEADLSGRVRVEAKTMATNISMSKASTYVEYLQGKVDTIFGGSYGFYNYYDTDVYGYEDEDLKTIRQMPTQHNSFVNVRPNYNKDNRLAAVFGAGTGSPHDRRGDAAQQHSYVLIDIPQDQEQFRYTQIFGAGAYNGLGMGKPYSETVQTDPTTNEISLLDEDEANEFSAVIDLISGKVGAAYGGSYMEGVTRRTVVNVPEGSTIDIGSIFGGAYGYDRMYPCDVFEANVNYRSNDAVLYSFSGLDKENDSFKGAIYGGNNSFRRTLYGKVNVSAIVWMQHPVYGLTQGNVFGGGYGNSTWSQYTEVNLEPGADVYQVYGGGQNGLVLNAQSIDDYMKYHKDEPEIKDEYEKQYKPQMPSNITDPEQQAAWEAEWTSNWNSKWTSMWDKAWKLGGTGYDPDPNDEHPYLSSDSVTNLENPLARTAEIDHRNGNAKVTEKKYNTNVIIHGPTDTKPAAVVQRYAYGGGLGEEAVVSGSTYIALLGGKVVNDIYAAGTSGAVEDLYGVHDDFMFTASTTAYVEGGTARNVYGGGWRGGVGYAKYKDNTDNVLYEDATTHEKLYEQIPDFTTTVGDEIVYTDRLAEAHVVIGKPDGTDYIDGKPSITRNVYGGGEGGAVFGTTYISIYDGYIGYRYNSSTGVYDEELDDQKVDELKERSGCVFGGGYVGNSYVDNTNIKIYGGTIRSSVYGGGEIAPIGRGTVKPDGNYDYSNTYRLENNNAKIYKAGSTHIEMYGGWVKKNVFGGGRGIDNWGGDGTKMLENYEKAVLDLSCRGYVFGQTDVNIYGGEIGTEEGVEEGYGNVFGGGDLGYVYSAYMQDGKLHIGKKPTDSQRFKDDKEGYYYRYNAQGKWVNNSGVIIANSYSGNNLVVNPDPEGTYTIKNEPEYMTEDCKVLIEPHAKVLSGTVNILSPTETETVDEVEQPKVIATYTAGQYIPTSYLNNLKGKDEDSDTWTKLDGTGIIIHNAVFAGGNITEGSEQITAKTTTIYGNATASINDVYNRDLITIGTDNIGGLYGDGNLTFVDGYRELNITNYGTDYYHISPTITIGEYNVLPAREKAYYQRTFKYIGNGTITDNEGTTYNNGATIPEDELMVLFAGTSSIIDNKPNPSLWLENGVVSVYAGRIMNTIQRADFCGVFGSRMVLKGAQDRVVESTDHKVYTINRVREVSLNKVESSARDTEEDNILHGNYFGIYNTVNYLGALTSDVDFKNNTRKTRQEVVNEHNELAENEMTFEQWKAKDPTNRWRNNGISHNLLALASGVYLELTTEETTGNEFDQKVWGMVTGVIELDLINVQPGIGGGFIYAKNEHGVRSETNKKQITLTDLNINAVSNKAFTYNLSDASKERYQTSGNFVRSVYEQPIIDDCYNVSGKYKGSDASPAHYWFIQSQVYVYDQYITAYTGSPTAYSETVQIPLTITAAANGTMTLMNVKPNRYAYYSAYTDENNNTKLESGKKMVINNVSYYLNDPISYWDWYQLPRSEQKLFVEQTYVTIADSKVGTGNNQEEIPSGYVMDSIEYKRLLTLAALTDITDDGIENAEKTVIMDDEDVAFGYVFRQSNNIAHNTGYMLTYNMTNPGIWDKWYTLKDLSSATATSYNNPTSIGDKKITAKEYNELTAAIQARYDNGPTYRLKDKDENGNAITAGLFGQNPYNKEDIIPYEIYHPYNYAVTNHDVSFAHTQASFEPAYVTTGYVETFKKAESYDVDQEEIEQHLQPNVALAQSEYTSTNWDALSSSVELACVCTSAVEISSNNIIVAGQLMPKSEKEALITDVKGKIQALGITGIAGNDDILELEDDLGDEQIEALHLNTDQTNSLLPLVTLWRKIESNIQDAYYCTNDGYYGGNYYEPGHNYRAKDVWSSMSDEDRSYFTFNYDALDLLIDPSYGVYYTTEDNKQIRHEQKEGKKYQYDDQPYNFNPKTASESTLSEMIYSLTKPVDYIATYNGSTDDIEKEVDGSNIYHMNGHETVIKDATLIREHFESLPNEKRYYSPILVTAPGDYYVVDSAFTFGITPYAVGATIEKDKYEEIEHDHNSAELLSYIKTLTFTEDQMDKVNDNPVSTTFYYCRQGYKIGEKGEGASVTGLAISGAVATATYNIGNEVPQGIVISAANYSTLANRQQNFTIHGISPTETSTLYVTQNSDLYDLSKEKIITVIYKYDYEGSDESGLHITPYSERHVVNIHINFQSGIPYVDDIDAPETVLPGVSLTMETPKITEGAYRVFETGWEIFESKDDADSHKNGIKYVPSNDPLYWYQNGYSLAYYAKTYLGKTYSNTVPISVANYHDLKNVMEDKKYHLHVDYDRDRLDRDSKIYINDYSGGTDNGLDLLKNLFDLSLLTSSDVTTTDGVISTINIDHIDDTMEERLKGHALLNPEAAGGSNLQFILRADIDHADKSWTPLGLGQETESGNTTLYTPDGQDVCFEGTLHGDGYTISGMSATLFQKLCGDVYNLGVTGSFTGAGIAETGKGYIENSWISTTGTPDGTAYAVFGNPSRSSTSTDKVQLVNSYYPDNLGYKTPASNEDIPAHGIAIAKPAQAFYNGEVAYDLNGFYLNKRFYDGTVTSAGTDYYSYSYIDPTMAIDPESTAPKQVAQGYYPITADAKYGDRGYVENDRYADGDFRYAGGTIPTWADKRERTLNEGDEPTWLPVWPDDYIFFGQNLTYGYVDERAHDEGPSHYNSTNRVYRAPAYYGNSSMSVAHFNPGAVLAATENPATVEDGQDPRQVYPGMTAIDFTGKNDVSYNQGQQNATSTAPAIFYAPLLDFEGLTGFRNDGQTKNMLVYAPESDAASVTVLDNYLFEPEYFKYACQVDADGNLVLDNNYPVKNEYLSIRKVENSNVNNIHGHLVLKRADGEYYAARDQFLVDKNDHNEPFDFNAPISYVMDGREDGYKNVMWYQRVPDIFVKDASNGWESISLPFTVQTVSTNQKGIITHFYEGSKVGHEYWLRTPSKVELAESKTKILFKSLAKASAGDIAAGKGTDLTYSNSFLWDHYYSKNSQLDKNGNGDKYHAYYNYGSGREPDVYKSYPFAAAAQPYLIGFPSDRYYEFDLSGQFEALTTVADANPVVDPSYLRPGQIGIQTITFVSDEYYHSDRDVTIGVSDMDYDTEVTVEGGNYRFKPIYQTKELNGSSTYLLNKETGKEFNNTDGSKVSTTPFRAYFIAQTGSGAPMRSGTHATALYLGYLGDQDDLEEVATQSGLIIYTQDMNICVESTLEYPAEVTIMTVAGKALKQFTIQPATKVSVPVNSRGVYIVNRQKIAVTK